LDKGIIKDNSKVLSAELYDIIEKANPEIIFEEFDLLRTDDEYYRNGHYKYQTVCSIETTAIMKYLENHKIIHIPVDTYNITGPPEDLYTKISDANKVYDNLVRMNFLLSCQRGFLYLNSKECSDSLDKIHAIEEEIVNESNDKKLLETYKSWQFVTDSRDNEMMKNIYHYSETHCYNNAIFIVGADHRKSIIDKIQNHETKNRLKLNWNFKNH
jgi:hypothetical protein